ncbi:MAG: geranylgeranylglycerol-phosphate geranylgeranyltransferase [Candidatus Poseidonia sp.]|nr:geranylgeranylglycerol-phosphate geranylgeranyltransferase [Poseidonia sp.]
MAGTVGATVELMRPKNLILAGLTVPLGAAIALKGTNVSFPLLPVMLHTFAVVFFTGAGNAMNDIKDREIDKEAHPHRPLPSGRINIEQAQTFTRLLWFASVACLIGGLFTLEGYGMSNIVPSVLIYVLAVILMVTYDHGPTTKNAGLLGNLVISLLVGAVILYGAAGVGYLNQPLLWWIFGVVFLTNTAREMVKDCMDMEADEGIRTTLPMKYGKEKVRMAAYVILMFSLVCLYMPFWLGPFAFGQLVFQTPAILALITLNGPLYLGNDELVAGRIRAAMLLGLIGFVVPMML